MGVFAGHRRKAEWVLIAMAVVLLVDTVFFFTGWAPALLNPEGEFRPYRGDWLLPVVISIALSAVAGYAWYELRPMLTGSSRAAATYLCGLFWLMAVDDFVAIHEKIERTLGVDWLFVYFPLMAVGAAAGGYLIIRTWHLPGGRGFRWLAICGATCWFIAQVLEGIAAFWDDAYLHANVLVVPEEALETMGSGLFALSAWALYAVLGATDKTAKPGGDIVRAR